MGVTEVRKTGIEAATARDRVTVTVVGAPKDLLHEIRDGARHDLLHAIPSSAPQDLLLEIPSRARQDRLHEIRSSYRERWPRPRWDVRFRRMHWMTSSRTRRRPHANGSMQMTRTLHVPSPAFRVTARACSTTEGKEDAELKPNFRLNHGMMFETVSSRVVGALSCSYCLISVGSPIGTHAQLHAGNAPELSNRMHEGL